jgi:hypothetical protein
MPGPPSDTDDFDTPWKRVLAHYFDEFLAFYFPDIHAAIDWQRPYSLLDKELAQATRTAAIGRRVADTLVRVHSAGGEQWVLIHVEVQTSHDSDLAERMFVYNYRICGQHRCAAGARQSLCHSDSGARAHTADTFAAGAALRGQMALDALAVRTSVGQATYHGTIPRDRLDDAFTRGA